MNLAVGRLEESGDQPQRRGLATAGRAQQADQLPVVDPQRDLIDDRDRSKAFCQAAQINGRQSTSSLTSFVARHCEEPTGPAFAVPHAKLRAAAIYSCCSNG